VSGTSGLIPPGSLGLTWPETTRQAPRRSGGPGPPGWPVCWRGGWGSARLLEHPSAAGRLALLGYSMVTSCSGAPGLGRRCIHGRWSRRPASRSWSQQRLRRCCFGEAAAAVQGEPWQGGRGRKAPCLVATFTVATTCAAPRVLPPLAGAVLDPGRTLGERPYRIEGLPPLRPAVCVCGLVLASAVPIDCGRSASNPASASASLSASSGYCLRETRPSDLHFPSIVGRFRWAI